MREYTKPFLTDMHGNRIDKGATLTCPVCQKEFIVDESTKFYCAGGYVCEWKCFLKHVKEVEAKKALEPQLEVAKGRKRNKTFLK